jgi:hypothetical protein
MQVSLAGLAERLAMGMRTRSTRSYHSGIKSKNLALGFTKACCVSREVLIDAASKFLLPYVTAPDSGEGR